MYTKNLPPTSFRSHGHLEPSCGLLTFWNRSTAVLRLEAFLGSEACGILWFFVTRGRKIPEQMRIVPLPRLMTGIGHIIFRIFALPFWGVCP